MLHDCCMSNLANSLMPSDIEIYQCAKLLIDNYGDDASIHAAMKADEMLAQGSLDGKAVWLGVIMAIEELQSGERPEVAKVH